MPSPNQTSVSRPEANPARRRARETKVLLAAVLWPISVLLLGAWAVLGSAHLEDFAVSMRVLAVLALLGLVPAIVALGRCDHAGRRAAIGAVLLNLVTAGFGLVALLQ